MPTAEHLDSDYAYAERRREDAARYAMNDERAIRCHTPGRERDDVSAR